MMRVCHRTFWCIQKYIRFKWKAPVTHFFDLSLAVSPPRTLPDGYILEVCSSIPCVIDIQCLFWLRAIKNLCCRYSIYRSWTLILSTFADMWVDIRTESWKQTQQPMLKLWHYALTCSCIQGSLRNETVSLFQSYIWASHYCSKEVSEITAPRTREDVSSSVSSSDLQPVSCKSLNHMKILEFYIKLPWKMWDQRSWIMWSCDCFANTSHITVLPVACEPGITTDCCI